jgi:hypothetical protein
METVPFPSNGIDSLRHVARDFDPAAHAMNNDVLDRSLRVGQEAVVEQRCPPMGGRR